MQLSSLLCFVLQTIAALFSPDSQPHLTQLKFSCVPPPCPMDWTCSKGSVWGSHRVYLTCFSSLRDHTLSNVISDHTQGLTSSVLKTTTIFCLSLLVFVGSIINLIPPFPAWPKMAISNKRFLKFPHVSLTAMKVGNALFNALKGEQRPLDSSAPTSYITRNPAGLKGSVAFWIPGQAVDLM